MTSSPSSNSRIPYGAGLERQLEILLRDLRNPGEARATSIVLTNPLGHNQSQEVGMIYTNGINLYITVANVAALKGNALTASDGTVTVSTP